MNKQQQWQRAAVVLKWIDECRPKLDQAARDKRAVNALLLVFDDPPWEYPWQEVVRSLRDRSAKKGDKPRK